MHYIDELKKQGANWVHKQDFWLFGVATFKDGNQITDRQVVVDAQHFFNLLDRQALTPKQTLLGAHLKRLAFLEYGKLGTNAHIHFLIKGIDLKRFKQIYYAAPSIWQSRINKAHNLIIKDSIGLDNTRSEYCWKEVKSHLCVQAKRHVCESSSTSQLLFWRQSKSNSYLAASYRKSLSKQPCHPLQQCFRCVRIGFYVRTYSL